MQIALVGLGKMGGNMVQRLLGGGHQVIAYDRDPKAVAAVVEKGAVGASSIEDMMGKFTGPKAVWLMLPAGDPTESTMHAVIAHMQKRAKKQ